MAVVVAGSSWPRSARRKYLFSGCVCVGTASNRRASPPGGALPRAWSSVTFVMARNLVDFIVQVSREVVMTLVVRAFPLRGSMSDLAAFASQLKGARAKEASQFYRHYGVEYRVLASSRNGQRSVGHRSDYSGKPPTKASTTLRGRDGGLSCLVQEPDPGTYRRRSP